MTFIKYAESQFTQKEIYDSNIALVDQEVIDRFTKYAKTLNAIAPKAKDFLYFSCIIIHSCSAALVNQKTGESILDKDGKPVTAKWEIHPKTGSWKWVCSDTSIKPYKNNNGDIFPEVELKKAYKSWREKPLCVDHASNTVDGVRGLIIDTYWDNKFKRVIALCALDKKNYPELARKVESKYATNVSMGCAVSSSICFKCGNIAKTEKEYCQCVRNKSTYGEINIGLSPIELSIVVTGADPAAKLRHIIASLDTYSIQKQERIAELQRAGCVTPGELDNLRVEIDALKQQLDNLSRIRTAALDPSHGANMRALLDTISNPDVSAEAKTLANERLKELLSGQTSPDEIAKMETEVPKALADDDEKPESGEVEPPYGLAGNEAMTGGQKWSGTEDPDSSGPPPWSFDGRETRLASKCLEAQISTVLKRLDDMQSALQGIQAAANRTKEEKDMSDLKERARARRAAFEKNAYHQGGGGVNDPQVYPKDPMAEKVRDTEDKQMVGEGMEMGNDGLAGNDLALKQKLSRAQLEERRLRRHALLARGEETHTVKAPDGTDVNLVKGADGKWTVAVQKDDDAGIETLAYWQGGGGVNEPQVYPKDPMAEKVRNTEDKQMVGEGMEMGNDGLAGDDLATKKRMLRAELVAKFIKVYANQEKTAVDRDRSRWEVYADGQKLLEATGAQIYGDDLIKEDYWNHLSSADYGKRILSEIRREGLNKVSYLLTGRVVTAQDPMPPMPPLPPVAPGATLGLPTGVPDVPPMPEVKEEKPGAEGTKDRVDEALADVEKAIGDLKEALNEEGKSEKGGKEELPPVEVEEEKGEVAKAASDLRSALDDNGDELAILSEVLGKRIEAGMTSGSEMDELMKLAEESLEASTELRSEAALIVEAKKGKMPEGLRKALEKKEKGKGKKDEDEEDKKSKKDKDEDKEDKKSKKDKDEDKKVDKKEDKKSKKDKDEDEEEDEGKKSEAELVLEKMLRARAAKRRELVRLALSEEDKELEEPAHEVHEDEPVYEDEPVDEDDNMADLERLINEMGDIDVPEEEASDAQYADEDPLVAELLSELESEGAGDKPEEPVDDMSSMANRRAWREKVAAEVGSKYQLKLDPATDMDTDMVPKAHPQGGTTLGGLDTKPSDEGARFESIDEVKVKIMKQVETLPKVREAVSKLGDMLKSGRLVVADLVDDAKLRALAVDPEAAKYWKAFYGEGDPACKQFGQDLVKEFTQKKAAVEAENYRLKLRRAVDLALDMQEKGLISQGREVLNRQVDDVMKFDDPSFEAFKRSVARATGTTKTAGKTEPALQVGIREDVEPVTLPTQLNNLWLPRK